MERNIKNRVLVEVNGLSKKFCKDLKLNMYYGISELIKSNLGIDEKYNNLRENEFWALKDISFKINGGDIVALLGINGSGKTTLIRILAEIYALQKGKIQYPDQHLKVISIFALKSGFHPSLTGRENLYLNGAYFGLSRSDVDNNMPFIKSFSSIGTYLDTPFGKYSSGMRTRLAMSLALSIKADLLFVDEAFSFSDPAFKEKCFDLLKKRYSDPGKALIIATHRLGKIENLANRILLLDKGRLIMDTHDVTEGMNKYLSICEDLNKEKHDS